MGAFVSFDEYTQNLESFGHIATWCVWNGRAGSEHVTAQSRNDYATRLEGVLHKNVVVLAYNFGTSAEWADRPISDRLADLRALPTYCNMYNAMRTYYAEPFAGTALWGAYATDLFKYARGQHALEAPIGVPSQTANLMPEWYLSDDGIALQVAGLKHELSTFGVSADPVFVLAHGGLTDPRIITALRSEFPDMRYERIYHYQTRNARLLRERLPMQVAKAASLVRC